jgi:hypothetical protein
LLLQHKINKLNKKNKQNSKQNKMFQSNKNPKFNKQRHRSIIVRKNNNPNSLTNPKSNLMFMPIVLRENSHMTLGKFYNQLIKYKKTRYLKI